MSVNIEAITGLFAKRDAAGPETVAVISSSTQKAYQAPDPDIVNTISEYLAEFESRLWMGEWETTTYQNEIINNILGEQGYPSQSEADQALTTMIAIEAVKYGVPPERLRDTVEAVFNRSGLAQRDKWRDRPDYRERTIRKALESAQAKYTSPQPVASENKEGEEEKSLLDINSGRLNLSKAKPLPRNWLLESMLLLGKVCVLAGLGGVSKTQLAIHLVIAIALGEPLMGRETKQGKTLLLLAEEDKCEAERRINADIRYNKRSDKEIRLIAQNTLGFGLVGEDTRLSKKVSGSIIDTGVASEIIRLALKLGNVKLIVLDHVGLYHGGDFNAREDAALTMRIVNYIAEVTGAAVLLLAHSPKTAIGADASDAGHVAGSTAFVDQARSALILATMRPAEAKTYGISDDMRKSYVSLTVAKNNYGPTGDVYWFRRVSFDGVGLLEYVTLTEPLRALIGGFGLEERVRDFIADHRGQLSKTKLRDTYGGKGGRFKASKGEVAAAVEDMLSDGRLVNRDPTDDERDKFDHGPRVKHVLDIGKVDD